MDMALLDSVALTDVGRRRGNNEDAVLRLPKHGVFCVADGMGGGEEGELASDAVVSALVRQFAHLDSVAGTLPVPRKLQVIHDALNSASEWIQQRSRRKSHQGMGTTAVLLAFDGLAGSRAVVLHAGDSRAYRLRDGRLDRLTRDHSMASVLNLDDHEEVPAMLQHVITRSVGMDETADLDTTYIDVSDGDLFLLCSDGLTNMISDHELELTLEHGDRRQLSGLAGRLVERANASGGLDNISVVLVSVGKLPPMSPLQRLNLRIGTWLNNKRQLKQKRGLYDLD